MTLDLSARKSSSPSRQTSFCFETAWNTPRALVWPADAAGEPIEGVVLRAVTTHQASSSSSSSFPGARRRVTPPVRAPHLRARRSSLVPAPPPCSSPKLPLAGLPPFLKATTCGLLETRAEPRVGAHDVTLPRWRRGGGNRSAAQRGGAGGAGPAARDLLREAGPRRKVSGGTGRLLRPGAGRGGAGPGRRAAGGARKRVTLPPSLPVPSSPPTWASAWGRAPGNWRPSSAAPPASPLRLGAPRLSCTPSRPPAPAPRPRLQPRSLAAASSVRSLMPFWG